MTDVDMRARLSGILPREDAVPFKLFADSAPVPIWLSGPDKDCIYCNRRWLEFTGRSLQQALGDGWLDSVHAEDRQRCLDTYNRAFDRREAFNMEYRLCRHDGEYRWLLNVGVPLLMDEQHFTGYFSSCVDITEHKQRNEIANREQAFLRQAIDVTPNLIFAKDRRGRFTLVNQAVADIYGTSVDALIGKTDADFNDNTQEVEMFLQADLDVMDTLQERFIAEEQITDAAGNSHWLQTVKRPIVDKDGTANQVLGSSTDITERKRVEAALRQSEFKFRALFELNIVPMQFWHVDGRVLDANDAFLQLVGCTRAQLAAGEVCWDKLTALEYADLDRRALTHIAAGKQVTAPYEKEYVRSDGRRVPVLIARTLLPGYRDQGISIMLDLTEQKRALANLQESQTLIKSVFSSLHGHVAVLDRDGTILAVNDKWAHLTQDQDGILVAVEVGTNYLDVCRRAVAAGDPHADRALAGIKSVLKGERDEFMLEYVCTADAQTCWFDMTVQPLRRSEGGVILSHVDISDRRRAELEAHSTRQDLAHLARVTMLGELTASLAHELNQPLTAILSNVQTAQRLLDNPIPDMTEIREILADISSDDQRAGEIIRGLRGLLKKSEINFVPLDINGVILEVVGFIRSDALIKHVVISPQLTPNLPAVRGDRIQLHQVLLNLAINALDAMKDTSASERVLTFASERIDEHSVQVSVQDAGTGIPADKLDMVFEPFITNKAHGLGMGLSICRSIVQMHGGRIQATPNADLGMTFQFVLPIEEGSSQ